MNRGLWNMGRRWGRNHRLLHIVAATNLNLAAFDDDLVFVDGTASIANLGFAPPGTRKMLRLNSTPTFVHSTKIVCLTAANVIAVAGDKVEFVCVAGDVWEMLNYSRADGTPLTGSSSIPKSLRDLMPLSAEAPATLFAQIGFLNQHPFLAFDTTTQWLTVWTFFMPQNYTNTNGIKVVLHSTMASAVAGTLGWLLSMERMDVSQNQSADHFGATTTVVAATVPGTAGLPILQSANITKGANMASVVAGDLCRLKVARDVATDTAAGNAQLHAVEVQEF